MSWLSFGLPGALTPAQKIQAPCPCEAQPGLGTGSCEGAHGEVLVIWTQSKEARNVLGTREWAWHVARFASPHQPSLSKG